MGNRHTPIKPPEWVMNRIKNNLAYDDVHGGLVWTTPGMGRKFGNHAGSNNNNGYVQIHFKHKELGLKNVQVHHIVWWFCTSGWPTAPIDHRDCNKRNNLFTNLRAATQSQNSMNITAQSNNKLGIKNVYLDTQQKYRVQVRAAGRKRFYRRFDSLDEAIAARDEALSAYHGEFARHD